MLGDPMFAAIDSQMRRFSLNEVSGTTSGYSSLSAIGITTGSDGKLTLDATKVRAALDKNSGAVAALFGATNGIAKRLDTALTNLLAGDGPLASRDKSLAQDNKALDTQKQNLDKRLTSVQQRYLVQFNALDSLMAQMKQTSTFLAQQLGSTSTTA
jgi:flagellar hook-associated protein 2